MLINNLPFETSLDNIIGELRNQLTLNGIKLLGSVRDTPNNIMVSCPYHKGGQERKPSAGIHKTDGVFHCFACGETHSLSEVISHCFGKYEDLLGAFGWEWLLKNFLTVSVVDRKNLKLNLSRDNECVESEYISEEELDSYRTYHPYMWKRRMTPEVVDVFDIGYDKKTQSITFPVRDISGQCVFVARRSVNTKFFNYPEGAEKPLYGLYELSLIKPFPQEVIICEGMIDAITCWVYGKYAVALNGLGNELQFSQLNSMPSRKYILGTDNDKAGQSARKRLHSNIKNKLIVEYVFPENRKDINDLSKEEFNLLEEVF